MAEALARLAGKPTFTASGREVAGTFQYVPPHPKKSGGPQIDPRRVPDPDVGVARRLGVIARENPDWDVDDWRRFIGGHPEFESVGRVLTGEEPDEDPGP